MVDGSVEYICSWKTLDLHVTTQCKLVKFEMLMLSSTSSFSYEDKKELENILHFKNYFSF